MKIFSFIDNFLNSITMYRLVLYGLVILSLLSIIFGFVGILPMSGLSLLLSLVILVAVCMAANLACAAVLKVPTNVESVYITAFILFLIMLPAESWSAALILVIAAVLAMVQKYIIAPKKRHIFNPVAFGALLIGLAGYGNVTWWIGSLVMLPFVLVFGLLVVRKIRRFALFLSFVGACVLTIVVVEGFFNQNFGIIFEILKQNFLSYPLIFLGTIMLTEPLTMPPTRGKQMIYGALVGVLFSVPFHFGIAPFIVYSSPELALILGNIYSYIVSFKKRLILKLESKTLIAKDLYEFSFKPDRAFAYASGQYLEWTIKHWPSDSRGNRRYFTIASSPTEDTVKLGVKVLPTGGSSFKKALVDLPEGESVVAGQLTGDFTLPADASKELVFIAGGIGITPFRSMIKFMVDKNIKREVTLFYSIKTEDEIAYKNLFDQAASVVGLKTIYVLPEKTGFINEAMVKKEVPDFVDRIFYLSGPNAMVVAYKKLLRSMGIATSQIKTDYFPGF